MGHIIQILANIYNIYIYNIFMQNDNENVKASLSYLKNCHDRCGKSVKVSRRGSVFKVESERKKSEMS